MPNSPLWVTDGELAIGGNEPRDPHREFGLDRGPWWDATGDLKLIITHGDMVWKLGSMVANSLASQSGWFRNAMRDLPVGGTIAVPQFFGRTSVHLMHQVIQCAGIGGGDHFFHCDTWEGFPSFLTYVKGYLVAEFFDIPNLKRVMLNNIEVVSKELETFADRDYDRKPMWQVGESPEKADLRSFIRAGEVFEAPFLHRPDLQKALYAAGDRLAHVLTEMTEFHIFIQTDMGIKFAEAIGIEFV